MDVIEVLKAKTEGMPDEVVITLTTQQAKALLDLLEAERQRADDAFILIGYAEDGKGFVYEPRHQDRISNPIAIYRRKES
jgi:DNA-binding PadR family transcriptional regulator